MPSLPAGARHFSQGDVLMPKPNYSFAKRQRELAKKQKKEAKLKEREAAKAAANPAAPDAEPAPQPEVNGG
jgi:hypothetical protein